VGLWVGGSLGPRKTLLVLIGFQTANKNHLKVAARVTMLCKSIETSTVRVYSTPIMESGARVQITRRGCSTSVHFIYHQNLIRRCFESSQNILGKPSSEKKTEKSVVSYHSKKELVHMHAASCDPVVLVQ